MARVLNASHSVGMADCRVCPNTNGCFFGRGVEGLGLGKDNEPVGSEALEWEGDNGRIVEGKDGK